MKSNNDLLQKHIDQLLNSYNSIKYQTRPVETIDEYMHLIRSFKKQITTIQKEFAEYISAELDDQTKELLLQTQDEKNELVLNQVVDVLFSEAIQEYDMLENTEKIFYWIQTKYNIRTIQEANQIIRDKKINSSVISLWNETNIISKVHEQYFKKAYPEVYNK